MRDIKYKAWDKIDKKMYEVSMIDTTSMFGYDTVYFIGHTSNNNGYRLHTEVELMEYAGMKDDKRTEEYPEGQEVYEGYTVKITDEEGNINKLDSNTGIGVVEWLNEWGLWNVSKIENSLGELKQCYNLEVIGNIYENPELLEK